MYTHQGTLGSEIRLNPTLIMTRDIRELDVNVDGFYSLFYSSEVNNAMDITLSETKVPGLPYVDPQGLKKLSVSVVKSSVVFMYADKRGLYLEYWSGEQYRKNCFTLLVQWKELGIEEPNESHFNNFLAHLKKGIMSRYFPLLLSKGSKARRAVLKVMDCISFAIGEIYNLCNNYSIQTNEMGSWDLYKDRIKIRSNLALSRITLYMITLKPYN